MGSCPLDGRGISLTHVAAAHHPNMATPSQYNANLGYDMPGSGKCVMEHAMRLFAVRSASRGVNCNVVIPGIIDSIHGV